MGWLADRDKSSGRLRRRGFPICAYVGPNGSGKSAVMVYDSIPSLDSGRPVLSTVRLLDFRNPRECPGGAGCDDPRGHRILRTDWILSEHDDGSRSLQPRVYATGEIHRAAHPYYVRFHDYRQLIDWRDGDVLMDEVTGVASSREIASLPVQVANYLVQLRRRNVVLRWTAPNWGRADKIIREVTQSVNYLVGSIAKRRPTPVGEAPRLWRDNRLFYCRTFDPTTMEEFEAHRADVVDAEFSRVYWRPGAMLELAYDTLDPVTSLGWANDSGMCMTCGGKRTLTRCGCGDHGKGRGANPGVAEQPGGPPDPVGGTRLLSDPLVSPLHPLIAATIDPEVLPTLVDPLDAAMHGADPVLEWGALLAAAGPVPQAERGTSEPPAQTPGARHR